MEHANGHTRGTPAPRLLPWLSLDGNPCYLSRLADELEAAQPATGTDVLGLAGKVLDDPTSPYTEVRFAGLRLAECLTDALRVAEPRGMRLPVPDTDTEDTEEGEGAHGRATHIARSGLWS
ncbi:hypothetical protein ACIRD9_31625 [Streptomyces violaceus]|uniref:hypothetical protein n=1 Tax=Streptomyces violaceus TaxID=1936 RepID=UPI00380D1162